MEGFSKNQFVDFSKVYSTKSNDKDQEALIRSNLETLWEEQNDNSEPILISEKPERFAIAPMVDVTDNHFRHFVRSMSKESYLYTDASRRHHHAWR